MPSGVAGAALAAAVSIISSYIFLRLRCRGTGYLSGRRARWWTVAIIALTAAISTRLGLVAVALSPHVRAAYIGAVAPSGLLLGKAAADRGRQRGRLLPESLTAIFALPLARLDDAMGEDMQDWCDLRMRAVSGGAPREVSDAARYYYNQAAGRIGDPQAEANLRAWRDSVEHKIRIARWVDLDSPPRLLTALRSHPSTQDPGKYSVDDLSRLALRLRAEAENELRLSLALLYRLGYRKMLVYPYRPSAAPGQRHRPAA